MATHRHLTVNGHRRGKVQSGSPIEARTHAQTVTPMLRRTRPRSDDARETDMPRPTIILVHGAWADGSSWNAVASELQGQGFTVYGPPNLLRGVATDAAYIASFLAQRTSGPVVLV